MASLQAITISVLLLLTKALNHTVICDETRDPKCAQTVSCPSTDQHCDLHVTCTGQSPVYESCVNSHINCTHAKSCKVDCNGESSCDSLIVSCPSDGICNIQCKELTQSRSEICQDIVINANKNTTTIIECRGDKACKGGKINCSHSSECDITCHGVDTCSFLNITAQNSNSLTLSDCTGGTGTCNYLQIYCPQNHGTPSCILSGIGVYNERDQFNKEILSGGIDIYAKHSWMDVIISDYSNNNPMSGTMHCGNNWNSVCNITNNNNNSWSCMNNEIICLPTMEPTSYPTMEPTYIPTLNPTINPTKYPTYIPTYLPTFYPTINPTISPTEITISPTFDPTYEPTLNPIQLTTEKSKELVLIGGLRYGMTIGIIIAIIFVCIMFCGWKYWNNGNVMKINKKSGSNDRMQMFVNEKSESDESERGNENNKTVTMSGMNVSLDKYNHVIEINNKKNKKKKKKKKKKKRKKNINKIENNNAGHYQKQTDDPFQGTWTELTHFN